MNYSSILHSVLRYANDVTNVVPNYGKENAYLFVGTLIVETGRRSIEKFSKFKQNPSSFLMLVFTLKGLQIGNCLTSNPSFNSCVTKISTLIFSSHWFFKQVARLSHVDVERKETMVVLNADRPPLISIFASVLEIANIVSKVINSLAVGLVAQKAFTGQTEGKIRTVVSAVLLGLSAFNVYYRVD